CYSRPALADIFALSLHDALPILDVVAVGDVGGVAAELGGDPAQDAQRLRGQDLTVHAHPHHEVAVVELLLLELGGLATVEPGSADRKSTRLNSSHVKISYAVFCL